MDYVIVQQRAVCSFEYLGNVELSTSKYIVKSKFSYIVLLVTRGCCQNVYMLAFKECIAFRNWWRTGWNCWWKSIGVLFF